MNPTLQSLQIRIYLLEMHAHENSVGFLPGLFKAVFCKSNPRSVTQRFSEQSYQFGQRSLGLSAVIRYI